MRKPKMIIFDAGRTLIDYASFDTRKGVNALMPYITVNPRGLCAEEIDRQTSKVFEMFEASREQLFEVPEQTILRLVHDLLGLEFSIPLAEIERIIWEEDAVKVPIPHADQVLEYLHAAGIQTAVLSNLDFSGYLLKEALDELYPGNHFKFVIASSDYGIRKPNPLIFQAAIAKSGFSAGDIWYVGDKLAVDVVGSTDAGMVSVLYKFPRNHYEAIPEGLMIMEDFRDLLKLIDQADS